MVCVKTLPFITTYPLFVESIIFCNVPSVKVKKLLSAINTFVRKLDAEETTEPSIIILPLPNIGCCSVPSVKVKLPLFTIWLSPLNLSAEENTLPDIFIVPSPLIFVFIVPSVKSKNFPLFTRTILVFK